MRVYFISKEYSDCNGLIQMIRRLVRPHLNESTNIRRKLISSTSLVFSKKNNLRNGGVFDL